MDPLRHPSSRPTVVVDDVNRRLVDAERFGLGKQAPVGRGRMLLALPLDPGPALLRPPTVLHDDRQAYLADADASLVGFEPVWVSRMLKANWVEDTRRLG